MVEVTFTDAAKQHLEQYLGSDKAVRFSVRKSGCSGFKYVAEPITQAEPTDIKVCDAPCCYLAQDSVSALNGMTIDHKVSAVGSELVYHNPNAQDICGCGESFKVIDEKR